MTKLTVTEKNYEEAMEEAFNTIEEVVTKKNKEKNNKLDTALPSADGVQKLFNDLMDKSRFFSEVSISIPLANKEIFFQVLADNAEVLSNRCIEVKIIKKKKDGFVLLIHR